ncbi:hypothetical protein [cyanobacterium endosymbiont of Rhopalodia gibberula]|uniref:hypothetical protein n=1 Tax=cyanobacterium endosymbiont of Rhopalodia gibberula TaxID=1763363 RepID=UPI00155851C2|nr:hypothetical protein [cyanobacterium endosymbiont of Rhopalodia gibberula]
MTLTIVVISGSTALEYFFKKAVTASNLYTLRATFIHLLTGIIQADLPKKKVVLN